MYIARLLSTEYPSNPHFIIYVESGEQVKDDPVSPLLGNNLEAVLFRSSIIYKTRRYWRIIEVYIDL